MRAKLGLPEGLDDAVRPPLVDDLLGLLAADHVDHTSFFRALGTAARGDAEPARRLFLDLAAFDAWLARWRAAGPGRRRRWTASTRSTSPATTSSRRRSPPRPTATWPRSTGSSTR